jgi:transcriptional regulator with XRE-family HTH domain
MDSPEDRTASLMTPAKLAQVASAPVAPTPAGFLDRMAADVGHQHVERLAQLRVQLEAQSDGRLEQAGEIQVVLQRMLDALSTIDFAPLQQRNWWADLTGKSRSAGATFAGLADSADEVARELATAIAAQQKQQVPGAAAQDRTMVEFDVEYQALDKVIHQGTRWLQDMRNQIKARQAQPGAVQADVRDDEARCELLVERLKRLRAAAGASQQAHEEVLATAARRAELAHDLGRLASVHLQAWRSGLSALASAAMGGKAPAPMLAEAAKVQGKLGKKLEALLADAAQLGTHESAVARQLAAMGEQLAAVG